MKQGKNIFTSFFLFCFLINLEWLNWFCLRMYSAPITSLPTFIFLASYECQVSSGSPYRKKKEKRKGKKMASNLKTHDTLFHHHDYNFSWRIFRLFLIAIVCIYSS